MARQRTPEAERKTRESLFLAGARAFLRDGYEATSMKSLAEEAGCTTGKYYCYYSGKPELLKELLTVLFEKNRREAQRFAEKRKDSFYGAVVFSALLLAGSMQHEPLREICREGLRQPEAAAVAEEIFMSFVRQRGGASASDILRVKTAVEAIPCFLRDEPAMDAGTRGKLFLSVLLGILGRTDAEKAAYLEAVESDAKSIRERSYDVLIKLLAGPKKKTVKKM